MNQPELANFQNASTFSHIGRWATAFRLLNNRLGRKAKKILDLGGGCLEPVYFSQMLPQWSVLEAVDANEDIYQTLIKLNHGQKISLEELAKYVCNKEDDGSPRPNRDLTDSSVLAIGLKELTDAGLYSDDFFEGDLFKKPLRGAIMVPVHNEAGAYAREHPQEYDLTTMNVVFLNIAKDEKDYDNLVSLARDVLGTLKEDGLLGVGTTPKALYGERGTPTLLEEGGAVITDLIIENLVRAEINDTYRLFGGHFICASPRERDISPIESSLVQEKLEQNEYFGQVKVRHHEISSLKDYLSKEDGYLLLAALRRDDGYEIWETLRFQLEPLIPKQRTSFGLLKGLG